MRVIVAGSRSFENYDYLKSRLKGLLSPTPVNRPYGTTILSGHAKGADTLGEEFGNEYDLPVEIYEPEWDKYGKPAGVVRNMDMAQTANALVAFWDGESSGTRHMIETALKLGLEVHVYRF